MSAGRLFQANQRPEQFLKRAILTSGSFEYVMNEGGPQEAAPPVRRSWRQEKGKTDSRGPRGGPALQEPFSSRPGRRRVLTDKRWAFGSPRPGPHHDLCLFQTKHFVGQVTSPSSSSDGTDHALPQNTRRQRTAAHGVMHSGSRGPHRLPHQLGTCGPWVVTRGHLENE